MGKPKSRGYLVAILAATVWLIACSDSGRNNEPTENRGTAEPSRVMSRDVEINVSVSEAPDRRILVAGSTNLPNGAELLISIENEVLGFTAQDNVTVERGRFSSVSLGPKSGLIDAEYLIEVLMPLPFTQSEQVQQIIGPEGEYLTGPLIEESGFGGKVVTFKVSHLLGSEAAIKQSAESHRLLVQALIGEATQLLEKGRKMEPLRETDNLASIGECGQKMRVNQSSAKALRGKTDALSNKYVRLGAAAIELSMCVSCSKTAMEACNRAATYLDEQNESNAL